MQHSQQALLYHSESIMEPENVNRSRTKIMLCFCVGLFLIVVALLVKEGYVILKW
jgi:hypothetical protein